MKNRIEDEIVRNWESISSPLVSICCYTYNQEDYIREAIDSFLMQETDFPFEIIIHDDASTDSTRDIIRLYQKKYPSLIKVIYQEENQYSKGKKIFPLGVAEAKGKYVAMCDGDDFWLDKNKITLQLNALQDYPECGICFHSAKAFHESNHSICGVSNQYSSNVEIYPVSDLIRGGGGFCPTASLMVKKDVFVNLPDWFQSVTAGDYYLQVLAASSGGALYLPNVMSAYRHMTPGSVSGIVRNFNVVSMLTYIEREIKSLDLLGEELAGDYNRSINYRKAEICREFSNTCLLIKSESEFLSLIEKSWMINSYNNKIQILTYFFRKSPGFLRILYKIKTILYKKLRLNKFLTNSGI